MTGDGPCQFHRRLPIARRRGNQYYRDKSIRHTETVCGAPVTEYDQTYRDKGIGWAHPDMGQMEPCPVCWPSEPGGVNDRRH